MTDSQNDESRIVLSAEFKGPLPPPGLLRQYEDVLPGSADRIFKMAEKALDHDISMGRAGATQATLGLMLASFIAVAAFAAAIVLVTLDQTAVGVGMILAETVTLAALFLRARSSPKKNGSDSGN